LNPHATIFDGLYEEWKQLLHQELALMREQEEAAAQTIVVDDRLDFLCTAISSTILAGNGGNHKAPEYERYYRDQPPSKLKRPVLGHQLDTMRRWPPSLTQADNLPAPFFLRTQRNNNDLTIADVEKMLLRLGEQVRKYEALLAQLLEEEEAAMQAAEDAELAAADAALAEIDAEREQAAARVAALQAQRKASKTQ
jgi:hypothetical protein